MISLKEFVCYGRRKWGRTMRSLRRPTCSDQASSYIGLGNKPQSNLLYHALQAIKIFLKFYSFRSRRIFMYGMPHVGIYWILHPLSLQCMYTLNLNPLFTLEPFFTFCRLSKCKSLCHHRSQTSMFFQTLVTCVVTV